MTEQTLTLEQLMAQVAALNAKNAELAAQNEQLKKSAPPFSMTFNVSKPLADGTEGSKYYGTLTDNVTGKRHNFDLYERVNKNTGEVFLAGYYKGEYKPSQQSHDAQAAAA